MRDDEVGPVSLPAFPERGPGEGLPLENGALHRRSVGMHLLRGFPVRRVSEDVDPAGGGIRGFGREGNLPALHGQPLAKPPELRGKIVVDEKNAWVAGHGFHPIAVRVPCQARRGRRGCVLRPSPGGTPFIGLLSPTGRILPSPCAIHLAAGWLKTDERKRGNGRGRDDPGPERKRLEAV